MHLLLKFWNRRLSLSHWLRKRVDLGGSFAYSDPFRKPPVDSLDLKKISKRSFSALIYWFREVIYRIVKATVDHWVNTDCAPSLRTVNTG